MKRIGDYISVLDSAETTQDLFSRFAKIMCSYGYDKTSFGCATDCPSIGLQKKHGHVSNFDAGWLEYYNQNELWKVDPVYKHAVTKRTPRFWSQCLEHASPEGVQLMREAADAGLKHGIVVPLTENHNEISVVSIASDEELSGENYGILAAVTLLSRHFYHGYKSIVRNRSMMAR